GIANARARSVAAPIANREPQKSTGGGQKCSQLFLVKLEGGRGGISSCTPVAKEAPAKALVWKQSRKPDWNGHKHYQAKTAAGCYSVAAEYQPGKGFIGYRVTQSVADKRRVIASSITVDEGKALAQRDYEQGGADERTRQAPQPMTTIRVPLG